MGLHVGAQVADGAVGAGAPVVLAAEPVDHRLLRLWVRAGDGDSCVRWFIRHAARRTRVDVHVYLIGGNGVMYVAGRQRRDVSKRNLGTCDMFKSFL